MQFYRVFNSVASKNVLFSHLKKFRTCKTFIHTLVFKRNFLKRLPNSAVYSCKKYSVTSDNGGRYLDDDTEVVDPDITEDFEYAKNSLFKDSSDKIILEINKAASIEDVFKVFKQYEDQFKSEHFTQFLFALHDLQIIYFHVNNLSIGRANVRNFMNQISTRTEFVDFLNRFEELLPNFNSEYLSYSALYLNKLGLEVEDVLIQKVVEVVRRNLEQKFHLIECTHFFKLIFSENSIRPYYQSINFVPNIFSLINTCDNKEDLLNLTICLNKVHNLVTDTILNEYKDKVTSFINNKMLGPSDYKVLLKIIYFLNYPEWINKNIEFISKIILLMKDTIPSFKLNELIQLYQLFFKNQESGEVLSTIQRSAAKFFQQLEEYSSSQMNHKLKLFSCLIYFSSPIHRINFRKYLEEYIDNSTSYQNLSVLRKVLCYLKISDNELCKKFWDKILEDIKLNKENIDIYQVSQSYINFNTDIENYRHLNLENYILKYLTNEFKYGNTTLFISTLVDCLAFFLLYGKSREHIYYLCKRLDENITQIKQIDCLKLSQAVNISRKNNEKRNSTFCDMISKTLNKATQNLMQQENDGSKLTVLLRSNIYRNEFTTQETQDLLMSFKNVEFLSSKMIENLTFCFINTNSLIPEVVNKFTHYITKNKEHILAFNVEKVLFMCYFLGYYPINGDEFFPIASDILIRDQERLSGLSFIQSALALCFFNQLPNSFIKLIFNVEFMDKLDTELANCYSKDKYPHRVRKQLMELNRAVCLEYPESNVPWFHKKYIEEIRRKAAIDHYYEKPFTLNFQEYLMQVVTEKDSISENVITPYGYFIDFVVNLNSKNSSDIVSKIAILLVRPHVYTNFFINLKGSHQLKKRHLEMFGYKVSLINLEDWMSLLYSGERLEFIREKLYLEDKR